MKNTIFAICIFAASCYGGKKSAANADTSANSSTTDNAALPVCVRGMIDGFKKEEKQNPPRKIYSYTYKGNTVYYVTAPCCDFFSDLYDSNCKLIGHPDGGITGKGDGKFTDFSKERTNEKLLWEDGRK